MLEIEMGRTILGVVAGVVVMFLVIMGIETIGHAIYPPPAGLDATNPAHEAAFVHFIETMPALAKAILVLAWTLGAFAGGFVAAKIARHPRPAAVLIALVVMSGVVGMILAVPHPSWLAAAGLLLPIPAALLAARLARGRPSDSGAHAGN
ncbi:hypothetical protein EER27_13930 [Lysobacter psychrotolerans]|uniref:Uncharacterized protein n=2 Tax=Montanilutibacter psychrotolerans TaxID=1327343 RepID=A0A3M8SUR7_9GAMM|nr:hypothetical protein EER27_13930 [Lysobacter psychrotolerans]